jgi:hypothetical protein
MPINEWTEPIYLLQKGENKRYHFYFKRKKDENLSLRQLEKKLTEEYHTTMNKLWTDSEQLCKELKKYFADYDVKKFIKCYDFEKHHPKNYNENYVPISFTQLGDWAVQDRWEDRIFQETKDIEDSNSKLKLRIKADNDMEVFKLQEKARLLNLQDLVYGLEAGTLNGTQRQAITKSNKDLQDARNRDLGEVKDINQTNANLNADVKTEVTTNLLERMKQKRNELNDLNRD